MADQCERGGPPGWDWARLRQACVREAMSVLRHMDDAEEAAQEAMLRSWRKMDQCRAEDPAPWARQISRNEALRLAAQRSRPEVELPLDDAFEPGALDGELERLPVAETVRDALRQLTTADQLLIRLRYAEDLTQPQLAEVLDLPEGTVKIRLHRARAKMRELLAA